MTHAEKRRLRIAVAARRLQAGQFAAADAAFDAMEAERERREYGNEMRAHKARIEFKGAH